MKKYYTTEDYETGTIIEKHDSKESAMNEIIKFYMDDQEVDVFENGFYAIATRNDKGETEEVKRIYI